MALKDAVVTVWLCGESVLSYVGTGKVRGAEGEGWTIERFDIAVKPADMNQAG